MGVLPTWDKLDVVEAKTRCGPNELMLTLYIPRCICYWEMLCPTRHIQ